MSGRVPQINRSPSPTPAPRAPPLTYQALARKSRPQDFSSLVGQETITTALRNALAEGRIAQAYLFSGIRGVGKTSAARVFAKALNCEKGPAPDPCNECATCREITAGSDMDVLEIDAATYSKVEQVRELTESLRYGAARDRYKVVVLDEVHRLSRQAFDALLKIVEEPPPHLVFVFATTEIDAVPATILSRCQEFQFRRVPAPQLAAHLRHLCEQESIDAGDAALRLVARAAEGSVRDAVALLDQLATFGSGTVRDEDAQQILGGFDEALFRRLLDAFRSGDAPAVGAVAAEVEANGWDPHAVYVHFLGFLRDVLHLASGADPATIDRPIDEARELGEVARAVGYESLLRLLHVLLEAEATVRRNEFGLLAAEIAWRRAAELPKLLALEDLFAGRAPVPPVSKPRPAATPETPASGTTPAERPRGPAANADGPPSTPPPTRSPEVAPVPAADPAAKVEEFLGLLRSRRPPLAGHFRHAKLDAAPDRLRITPPPGDGLLSQALRRSANHALLDELVQEVWGAGAIWSLEEPSAVAATDVSTGAPKNDPARDLRDHPTAQAVLQVFDGSVRDVSSRPRDPEEEP